MTEEEKIYVECQIDGHLGCGHWVTEKCMCACHSALLKKREERVLEMIEGMEKSYGDNDMSSLGAANYNRALSDLREKITGNGK